MKAMFKVFPSSGSWSMLVGKPLLKQFEAIHNYKDDTLKIPVNGKWTTLMNKWQDNTKVFKGEADSPLRQVLSSVSDTLECIDKQVTLESFCDTANNSTNTATTDRARW